MRQGPFGLGLRWLGRYSPFQGCAGLAALTQAKIPPAIRKFIMPTGLKRGLFFLINEGFDWKPAGFLRIDKEDWIQIVESRGQGER